MSDKKNYVEWNKFVDKYLKQNKSLPTSNKTDEEAIDFAEKLIENVKRSRS